ncbi:MAG: molybdopterin-binding protein [Synergistaceae bacterium]|nr:molybdopterin-binding protein [Synergistaceae bacterium]
MKITEISPEEAVGRPLAHDLTKIDARTHTKGARFKKGHIITEADLPVLREMGREHLTVLELEPDEVHEDDAAAALCGAIRGTNCVPTSPSEGRITLKAAIDGFLCYDAAMIGRVNEDADWVLAATPPFRQVRAGQPVAGFRIRPLAMSRERVDRAAASSKIDVKPFAPLRAGLVTTGREIAEGRVEDAFMDKFIRKLEPFGGRLMGRRFCADDSSLIAGAIRAFIGEGADLVVCTGGMSVDADDRTPGAIAAVAGRIAFRGVPVLPGAMLMMGIASKDGRETSVIGAPACVAHDERTSLDRLLPFVFAGVDPSPHVRSWGVGGLCAGCEPCHWPECAFSA